MRKNTILGIILGTGIIGGAVAFIIRIEKRVRLARLYYKTARELNDEAADMLFDADQVLRRAQELVEDYEDMEDYENMEDYNDDESGDC